MRNQVNVNPRSPRRRCEQIGEFPLSLEVVVRHIEAHERIHHGVTNAL